MVTIAAINSIVSNVGSVYSALTIASKIACNFWLFCVLFHELLIEILMYYIKMILKSSVCNIDLESGFY